MDRAKYIEAALEAIEMNKRFCSKDIQEIINKRFQIEIPTAYIASVIREIRKGDNQFNIIKYRNQFKRTTNKYFCAKARYLQNKKINNEKLIYEGI